MPVLSINFAYPSSEQFNKISPCCRVDPALGAAPARRRDRADPAPAGAEVQRGQDDLPQVLRPPPPQGHQLQKEEVRSHLKHQAQEEAEVNSTLGLLGRKCVGAVSAPFTMD